MPINHKKKFGVYHWDTFDNETKLKYENDDYNDCMAWIAKTYEGRISGLGADRVEVVNKKGKILSILNIK